jgi:hypothetical protein
LSPAELVAAEARHRVLGAHCPLQRVRDVAQQAVAGGVAEAVVEPLEAVDAPATTQMAAIRASASRVRASERCIPREPTPLLIL